MRNFEYSPLPGRKLPGPGRNRSPVSPQSPLTREQLLVLCDCGFIQRGENILITGATGSGKSYLACAMGYQACIMGYRVLYYSMNRFVELQACARLDGSFIPLLNTIVKMPLRIWVTSTLSFFPPIFTLPGLNP
jgi:hypothetical protein